MNEKTSLFYRRHVVANRWPTLVLLLALACMATRSHAQIPLNGNLQHQEYGDAVYRQINSFWLNLFGADYNHTAVYAGLNSSHVPKVMEATGEGSSSGGDTTAEIDFSDINNRSSLTYYGAYTKSNLTMNFTGRKSIVATAVSIVDAFIPYVAFDAINYNSGGNSVGYIAEIRCDAVVEYAYEANGYIVWWPTANPSDWSILSYPGDHNDAPTPPTDPSYEFSPFAQRGAPGGSFFGQPGNTYMTRASVINLPILQLTQVTNAGFADVTIQATDESGIHYIGYKKPGETNWNYSPTQSQHPTSDTYTFGPVRITNSGTLLVFAMDNGGNYPTQAKAYTITVPPPDTTTASPLLIGTRLGGNMIFKWPTNALGFSLQWANNLSSANWSSATPAPVIVSGQYTVTNSISGNVRFYRLKK